MSSKRELTFVLIIIFIFTLIPTTNLYAKTETPSITSEAAIVYEVNTGLILYSKNENTPYYPASITKLLTALIAFETLDLSDTITFSEKAITSITPGSSSIGILPNETLTVNDALHGLLLMSANEIANGIAEKIAGSTENFAELMNQRAKELGAINSFFVNPHGLIDPSHVTTVHDMALITKALINLPTFLDMMKDSFFEIGPTNLTDETRSLYQQHKMVNTKNDLTIYREDVIAGKVGYTQESGHTLVTVAKKNERTLIIVLMKSDAKSQYADTEALLNYGFEVDLEPFLAQQATNDALQKEILENQYQEDIILPDETKEGDNNSIDNDSNLASNEKATNKEPSKINYFLWILPLGIAIVFLPRLSKRRINQLHEQYKKIQ